MSPQASSPIRLEGAALARHAASEWVLTNALGGFAMGTVGGVPMRRYHGLLVAAMRPPLDRRAALMAVDDALLIEGEGGGEPSVHPLTAFHFSGSRPGGGGPDLVAFEREGAVCRWEFAIAPASGPRALVCKELVLARGQNAAVLRYSLSPRARRAWMRLRPLVALRDFHGLLRSDAGLDRFRVFDFTRHGEEPHVGVEGEGVLLHLAPSARARWAEKPEWWFDFEYALDRARGDPGCEDLICPGSFLVELTPDQPTFELAAWVGETRPAPWVRIVEGWDAHAAAPLAPAPPPDLALLHAALVRAADQFVVARPQSDGGPGLSIIAGYPWFSDWGRDTMIALRGLLLSTRRFEEARAVLGTFAEQRRDGLLPNCFDDATGRPRHNSVDASLWFIHASCDYAQASGDGESFTSSLLPACLDIVEWYTRGTDHGIRVDPGDGLLEAGSPHTQLTWMDAMRDGVVFTPRHGKPVEVNALWYSALLRLAEALDASMPYRAAELFVAGRTAARSFRAAFWNAQCGALHDTLVPERGRWRPDSKVRPNQVFALALPHCPLDPHQQRSVLRVVRERLLTPVGLRTLDPADPDFRPRFEGDMRQRDQAYHNGTEIGRAHV